MMRKTVQIIFAICLFSIFVAAQNSENTRSDQSKERKYDTPIKILYKPQTAYPSQDKGSVCIQGTVSLRVQFLESGKIGEISVVSGLPQGATETSIEAAKGIKFEPATKDGKPITLTRVIQFNFSIY